MNERSRSAGGSPNNSTTGNPSRSGGQIPLPPSRTSFQRAVVNFASTIDEARVSLTVEEFAAFVSILTCWAARANRQLLERDERMRRRAA
jgi:hypothetical protein